MNAYAISPPSSPQLVTTLLRDTGSGPTRVAVAGELDIATDVTFRVALTRIIQDRGPDIVIDASSLTFCDARGVAAIVAVSDLAERRGGSVTITGVRPQVAKVLRITGLYRRFVPVAGAPAPRR
ncbi:STAS domain-containing protein [Actinomadura macra]|uniref:STAS domain-containing protein n=1 Tax=Actinomadura macra TaxID=46164 RepID=UPI0008372999|nr:STAS domain-containing protein [Actinomadura macra]